MVVEEKNSESLRENQINDDTTSTEQKTYSLESILLKKILNIRKLFCQRHMLFSNLYFSFFFFFFNYINFFLIHNKQNKKNNLNKCIKDIIKIIFYTFTFYTFILKHDSVHLINNLHFSSMFVNHILVFLIIISLTIK